MKDLFLFCLNYTEHNSRNSCIPSVQQACFFVYFRACCSDSQVSCLIFPHECCIVAMYLPVSLIIRKIVYH